MIQHAWRMSFAVSLALGLATGLALLACGGDDAALEADAGTPDGGIDAAADAGPSSVASNLRITEIGSCYWSDSSCWFELHNLSTTETEDLSDYTLHASATLRVDPYTVFPSHAFALPSKAIAPGAYVLIRGLGYLGLIDGPQVVHLLDGETVPWWSDSGAIELVRDGGTADFVRFGAAQVAPHSADAWSGGTAPALPSGETDYGHALARDLDGTDTDAGADWQLRAFSTAGGGNDLTSDEDVDADGLPDQAEEPGGHYAGLDLHALGARAGQRDIFIEVDWMSSSDPGLTPRREALQKVVDAFTGHGIAIHFDTGDLFAPAFDPAAFNLGGGEEVPYAPTLNLGDEGDGRANSWAYKAAHFELRRQAIFHYLLFGSSQSLDGSADSSGYAEYPGNDIIITLGNWELSDATPEDTAELINLQAATVMHELGHNLGLDHGGGDEINDKPNYVSIMNYTYQLYGMPLIGSDREGDRYYLARGYYTEVTCDGMEDIADLFRGPLDPEMVIDFSDGSGGPLDELDLDESRGLRRVGSAGVDFDCDGTTTGAGIAVDLNLDDLAVELGDHDDWGALVFAFQRGYDGSDTGAHPRRRATIDPLAFDRQRVAPERAPPAAYFAARRARR